MVTRSNVKEVHSECINLKAHIRFGDLPDAHYLFEQWMQMEESLTIPQSTALRRCFKRQCRVLLEAVCDDLVPHQWRCACLDQINKPLQRLKALSETHEHQKEYLGLTREIRLCSEYVHVSMTASSPPPYYLIEKTMGMIRRKVNQKN